MGAFGVALLTRQAMQEQGPAEIAFRGLDLDSARSRLRKETCDLCQNDCTITFADIEGVDGTPVVGLHVRPRSGASSRCGCTPTSRMLRLRQRSGARPARRRRSRRTRRSSASRRR